MWTPVFSMAGCITRVASFFSYWDYLCLLHCSGFCSAANRSRTSFKLILLFRFISRRLAVVISAISGVTIGAVQYHSQYIFLLNSRSRLSRHLVLRTPCPHYHHPSIAPIPHHTCT